MKDIREQAPANVAGGGPIKNVVAVGIKSLQIYSAPLAAQGALQPVDLLLVPSALARGS